LAQFETEKEESKSEKEILVLEKEQAVAEKLEQAQKLEAELSSLKQVSERSERALRKTRAHY